MCVGRGFFGLYESGDPPTHGPNRSTNFLSKFLFNESCLRLSVQINL